VAYLQATQEHQQRARDTDRRITYDELKSAGVRPDLIESSLVRRLSNAHLASPELSRAPCVF
jgi:hypothetical protein